jgi:hypothetical protein
MGKPPCPNKTELDESIQHVAYEVAAMERTFDLLTRRGGRFTFEAFLIHVRQVREFFWCPKTEHKKGLYAKHYFDPSTEWSNHHGMGSLSQTLKCTKKRVDRQLAHLARNRHGDFMDLTAMAKEMRDEILAAWYMFLDQLPSRKKRAFRSAYLEKRDEVAKSDF